MTADLTQYGSGRIRGLRRYSGELKVAESLYNGVPVLASPQAAQGIASAENLKVLGSEQEWISFLRPETPRALSAMERRTGELREFLASVISAK